MSASRLPLVLVETGHTRTFVPDRRLDRNGVRPWAALFLRVAFAIGLTACGSRSAYAGAPPDPNDVKADMLYNIAKFIKWPESSFDRSQGQLVFTILGDDPLAEALAASLSTKSINGHLVFVRVVRRVQDVAGSHILYIASSEASHVASVLKATEGAPELTVADSTGFVALGGMVDFSAFNDHVRFEINQARAEHAGLKISAKVLALARVVDATP